MGEEKRSHEVSSVKNHQWQVVVAAAALGLLRTGMLNIEI